MRLTAQLCRLSTNKYLKKLWRREGKFISPPLQMPPELKALGVKIHDALEVAKIDEPFARTSTSVQMVETDYNVGSTKTYYVFDRNVQAVESEDYTLCLTKSLLYKALPKTIMSLVGLDQLRNQDQLVKDAILQAVVLDSYLKRLPKKPRPTGLTIDVTVKPHYKYPREYGIPHQRRSLSLLQRLTLLAEMFSGRYPLVQERSTDFDATAEVIINRGGDTIVFQSLCDILLSSKRPLKPFATFDEVQQTKGMLLQSIHPVKPTIDLWKQDGEPQKIEGNDTFAQNVITPKHIHTLHVSHPFDEVWSSMQSVSRAIGTCFAFATREAKQLYGDDVRILPSPVCVQCVYTDEKCMSFLAYQLNTLDLDNDEGIKNQVWSHEPCDFYSEISEMHGIKDFNSSIFPIMLALYSNGVHSHSL